jgi:hypothetical protein
VEFARRAAVKRLADERVAKGCKVEADLVLAPGAELDLD